MLQAELINTSLNYGEYRGGYYTLYGRTKGTYPYNNTGLTTMPLWAGLLALPSPAPPLQGMCCVVNSQRKRGGKG